MFFAVLFIPFGIGSLVFAQASNENTINIDYSKFDVETLKNTADMYFQKALESQEPNRSEYLSNALAEYYILSNIDKSNIDIYINLARIYEMQKNDSYAKAYFYKALGINSTNINANLYFGNFYYDRNQFKKALDYYQKVLQYGKTDNALIYKRIGIIYDRFGDLPRANYYYKKSIQINSNDNELNSKLNDTIKEEYDKSGYYKRRLRN